MKRFPLRRWFSVVLRTAHLVAVTLLATVLHGAPLGLGLGTLAAATAASGGAMYLLDLLGRPGHWRETAGLGVMFKLAVIATIPFFPGWEKHLFWIVLLGSAVFAHAPASFRHRLVIGQHAGKTPARPKPRNPVDEG